MSLASNASAGSILEILNSTAPASLELPIGDWPRQDLWILWPQQPIWLQLRQSPSPEF